MLSLELAGRISQLVGHLWLRHPDLFTADGRLEAVDPAELQRDVAVCSVSPTQAATSPQSPVIEILREFRHRCLASILAELDLINEGWRQASDHRYDATRTPRYANGLRAVREPHWLFRPQERAEAFRERFGHAFLSPDLARHGFPYTGSLA